MTTSTTTDDFVLEEGFEGPEKRLEIEFEVDTARHPSKLSRKHKAKSQTPATQKRGMMKYSREEWQTLLDSTACTILSVKCSESWDAYLLSESSLFVSETRVVLKTCGRTLLLRGVDQMVAYGEALGMRVRRIVYSRKNYTFPHRQLYPHRNFEEEVAYLNERFPMGQSFVVGPATTDHWLFYIATPSHIERESDEYLLFEVKMHELDPRVMAHFLNNPTGSSEGGKNNKSVTEDSGIQAIIPRMDIDSFLFEPCGYSMNGLADNAYSTIHITPESHCSYVSYEAFLDAKVATPEYLAELTGAVLETFRPAAFTCTILSSSELIPSTVIDAPLDQMCSRFGILQHVYTCHGKLGHTLSVHTQMVVVDPESPALFDEQALRSVRRLYAVSRCNTTQPMPKGVITLDCTEPVSVISSCTTPPLQELPRQYCLEEPRSLVSC